MKVVLYFMFLLNWVAAGSHSRTSFVKSFIANERKPTYFILCDLCWEKKAIINLMGEVSKLGFRSSTSIKTRCQYQNHNVLYFVDLECERSRDIIINASTNNLFRSPFRWLMLTKSMNSTNLQVLWNSNVRVDSDVVLAEDTDDEIKLMEIHKTNPQGPMVLTPRGSYKDSLLDSRRHRELFRRRRNLMGLPLTMSNVVQDSNTTLQHLESDLEPQYDNIPKLCWMTVKLAMEMLNATPRNIFSYRWGYRVNGSWSGMIEDVHSGRADMGTNCALFNTDRLDVVSYVDTLAPFKVKFIFRQPPLPYVTNIFSLPFSSNVWIAVAVCAVVSTFAIYLTSKFDAKFGMGPAQLGGTIGDAMLMTMSAVSQQGCDMAPRRTPGRIIVLVLFICLMALYAAYSANIVVLLQAPSKAIRTLPQLAASKLTLAANDVDYNYFVFKLSKDPVRVEIENKVEPKNKQRQFYVLRDGVNRIREGLFAYHSIVEPVYRRIEETFLETEKCDLMEVDYLNSFDPHVPVGKGSPYMELLKVTFKQIRESGLKSALTRRIQVPKPRCSNKMSSFSSVGLVDMRPVLLLMLYGVVISVVVVILEMIVARINKRSKWSSDTTQKMFINTV